MPRSIRKGPFVAPSLLKKVRQVRESGSERTVIKTWSRSSMIIPDFIGLTFSVHNGKKFIPVNITVDMVGHKLGEFSPTRNFRSHIADKKGKKK
jgi:small subunit ribosomal protein S19